MARLPKILAFGVAAFAGLVILANILWPLPAVPTTEPFPVADMTATRLAVASQRLHQGNEDTSGFYALGNGREAFAARVALARAAERQIDAQYYIWHDDLSGKLLLNEMIQAADRGVKVRLLIDDNTTAGEDELLAAVNAHENIAIRLFNPFTIRFLRIANYLTDFPRLNRRMHNKSITADNSASIVGGRNIGDEYFAATDGMQYADADLMVMGKVADDVAKNFERFWQSESAYAAEDILAPVSLERSKSITAELAQLAGSDDAKSYQQLVERSNLVQSLINRTVSLEWTVAKVLSDDPGKALGKVPKDKLLASSIVTALSGVSTGLDIASAYFVPGEDGTAFLTSIAGRGVDVRLLTNTLASNDVIPVHAGYQRYRKRLLAGGVKLYELKAARQELTVQKETSPGLLFGASSASLHAKLFVLDGKRTFISSYNFDPRSLYLNCEMGIAVDSATLAAKMTEPFDDLTRRAAYTLSLHDGDITWHSGDAVFDKDPDSSWLQRVAVKVISLFPVEWML